MISNILSYLELSSSRYPDRIAVSDCNCKMTYRQLWESVSVMGNALYACTGQTNRPIAVCIRHDLSDILAFFSIVFSGNFYVPIDMSLPLDRISKMLNTVRPIGVITQAPEQHACAFSGIPVYSQDMLQSDISVSISPWKDRKDTDPLYVIFTSGSTGDPKGVSISHRSVIDMAEQFTLSFGFTESTVFGNQAPFDFDVSVKDIYLSLKVGGTLEILEKKLFSFPKLLIERLNERKVDTIIWAVPALNIISKLNAFKTIQPQHLKNVMFSGEIMPLKTLRYWMEHLPDIRFVNLYGPTEITCNCTYYVVTDLTQLEDAVPIGHAFPNCSVFLLSDDQLITKEHQIGEICVTGSCLALGYYNRLDLTANAFPQNPLITEYPERMYRTGDLGCYQNAQLVFMGRKDTQIKHMGHRIELTEIILCANAMPGVESASCVYDEESAKITLFYQGTTDEKALYAHLRDKLPRYMLPGALRSIVSFPKTRTGKIDNKALLLMAKGE